MKFKHFGTGGERSSLAKLDGSTRLENSLSHSPSVAASTSNDLEENTCRLNSDPIQ